MYPCGRLLVGGGMPAHPSCPQQHNGRGLPLIQACIDGRATSTAYVLLRARRAATCVAAGRIVQAGLSRYVCMFTFTAAPPRKRRTDQRHQSWCLCRSAPQKHRTSPASTTAPRPPAPGRAATTSCTVWSHTRDPICTPAAGQGRASTQQRRRSQQDGCALPAARASRPPAPQGRSRLGR